MQPLESNRESRLSTPSRPFPWFSRRNGRACRWRGSITGVPVIPIIVLMSPSSPVSPGGTVATPVRGSSSAVLDTRARIGVKGIDTVVLGGDQNDIVRAGRYREVRHIERLGIDLAVDGAREQLAEGRTAHRARCQGKLLAVCPVRARRSAA